MWIIPGFTCWYSKLTLELMVSHACGETRNAFRLVVMMPLVPTCWCKFRATRWTIHFFRAIIRTLGCFSDSPFGSRNCWIPGNQPCSHGACLIAWQEQPPRRDDISTDIMIHFFSFSWHSRKTCHSLTQAEICPWWAFMQASTCRYGSLQRAFALAFSGAARCVSLAQFTQTTAADDSSVLVVLFVDCCCGMMMLLLWLWRVNCQKSTSLDLEVVVAREKGKK